MESSSHRSERRPHHLLSDKARVLTLDEFRETKTVLANHGARKTTYKRKQPPDGSRALPDGQSATSARLAAQLAPKPRGSQLELNYRSAKLRDPGSFGLAEESEASRVTPPDRLKPSAQPETKACSETRPRLAPFDSSAQKHFSLDALRGNSRNSPKRSLRCTARGSHKH